MRQEFVSNGTLSRFLDRLAQLSSEKKRSKAGSKVDVIEEVKVEKKEMKKEQKLSNNNPGTKKKKKGVGYSTENG